MYPCPMHGKGKMHASVWDVTSTLPVPSALSVDSASSSSCSETPISQLSPSSQTAITVHAALLADQQPSTTLTSTPLSQSASASQVPFAAVPILRPAPSSFSLPSNIAPNSVHVITVIYVLSALHPSEWEQAIHNLYTVGYALHLPFFH